MTGKNLEVTIKLPPVEAGVNSRTLRVIGSDPAGKTFAMDGGAMEIGLVLARGVLYTMDLQDGNVVGLSPWSVPLVFTTPAPVLPPEVPVPVIDPNPIPVVPAPQPPMQPSSPTVDLSTAVETDDDLDVA